MTLALSRRHAIAGPLPLPLFVIGRARAATQSIQVGIYTTQQGEYVRKQIISKFEVDLDCKVLTTEGVTLTQIAAVRASRDNPKSSIMFMDDIGIELSKREGLAAATLTSPSVAGASFAQYIRRYIAYPESKMESIGLFAADWSFINPRRPALWEKYNQIFRS